VQIGLEFDWDAFATMYILLDNRLSKHVRLYFYVIFSLPSEQSSLVV
jgi:hypothetical protein